MAQAIPPLKRMNVFETFFLLIHSIVSNVFNPTTPFGRAWLYTSNRLKPNAIPEFSDIVDLRFRKVITEAQYFEWATLFGYNKENAANIYAVRLSYLDTQQYITLYRREKISYDDLVKFAGFHRVPKEHLDLFLESTEFFPSPADLVRFAVREVYTPDVARKFGLFDDLPAEFIAEAKKAGLPEDQARNYWGAHWELPSPLQGFEMLHRRVIDQDTLKMLLRALDVMPFWRDKLIDISYNPLTRVDVRRMYGLGVLDEDGVRDAYLDGGYSPENADKMTDFTIKYENNEADGITRANVVTAYQDDLITRRELKEYLELLGYSEDVVEFWLSSADYNKTLRRVKSLTSNIIDLYIVGDITIDDIRTRLAAEGLPAIYIERTIGDVLLQEARRRKVPSKADLETWLIEGIIIEDYYVEKMRLIGYPDDTIQNYLTEIAMKKDTTKRKYLPVKTYMRWYTKGIINEDMFRRLATEMRYSAVDIGHMISEAATAAAALITPE